MTEDANVYASEGRQQLKAIVERIETLEEEKASIAEDIKAVYAEAKACGFDNKILRKIIKLRKLSAEERQEEEALTDLYMHALGMTPIEEFISDQTRQEIEATEVHEDPDAGEGDAGDEAEATEEEPSPATDSEAPGDGDADDGDPTAPEASPDTEPDNQVAGDVPAAGDGDGEASDTVVVEDASPSAGDMPDIPPSLDRREETTTAAE